MAALTLPIMISNEARGPPAADGGRFTTAARLKHEKFILMQQYSHSARSLVAGRSEKEEI